MFECPRSWMVPVLTAVLWVSCSSEPPPLSETSTPVITDTVPTSPGRSRRPHVKGTAEHPSHVALFLTADCSGDPAVEGTSEDFAQTGFDIEVAEDTTTYLYARSTNAWNVVSACSEGFFYVHDETPPAPPVLSRTLPTSPNNRVLDPRVQGEAEPQSRVSIFKTADCTGEPQISVETNLQGKFEAQVFVRSSSETMFTALATDLAGNMSQCSEPLTYIHDPTRPSAATLQGTSPASPSTSTNPALLGMADPNARLSIFSGNSCEGTLVAVGFANSEGAFGIPVPAASNTTTLFTARAQNSAGTFAGCSNVLSYRHDAIAPAPPTLTRTEPESPSNSDFTPTLVGTAEAGSTVRIYRTAACTGSPLANVTSDATRGQFSVSVTVAANSRTTFFATATDAAGNVSGCTSTGLLFEHDATAPGLPTGLALNPAGPSSTVTTPVLSGTAEARARVAIFGTSNCSGTPVTVVNANDSGAFSVTVTVATNATTTFRAVATDAAGNVSACSTSAISYTHDSIPPRVPTLLLTSPGSPGNAPMPGVSGTADGGSTLRLFINNACTGALAGTGTAVAAGTFRVTLTTAVPLNATAQLYAQARDAAGNTSGCSTALPYVHDSLAPARPVVSSVLPASPSPDNTPTVSGTAEALARIRLYSSATCDALQEVTSGTASADAAGAFSVVAVVPPNRSTVLYARAEDAAGNVSPCSSSSVTYVHDGVAPDAPVLSGISPSPSNSTTPTVTGTAAAGSTVQLYLTHTCSGLVAGTGVAGTANQFSIVATVPANATSQLWARATDTAGNASSCSNASPTYTQDGLPPDEPRLSATVPASPSNNPAPVVSGTAEALAIVRIYRDSACSASVGTTNANGAGAFSISVMVTPNATSTLYARAWDAAGNASACSSTFLTYVHDGVVPAAPVLLASSPASPGTDAEPILSGTAEVGVRVQIFRAAACGGAAISTTLSNSTGQFSSSVRVTPEAINTLTARAIDAAGNESPCSAALTYVHDTQAPSLPVLLGTTPGSPGSALTPLLSGTAEAGSTVLISLSAGCASPVASGVVNASGGFSLVIPVSSNVTNSIYARARDAAGNTSACTAMPLFYVHDGISPAEPVLGSATPASPSSVVSPTLQGTAEAQAQVRLYFDGACAGVPVASGVAAANGTFQLTVTVAPNATRTIYAQATDAAGNASPCSTSAIVYVHDGLVPAAPTVTGTAPVSPSSQPAPALTGTSEPHAQIETFLNAACSGTPVGRGVANASGAFSVASPVRANASNTLYAQATDAAGNTSDCSTTSAAYTHDAEAPAAPVITGTNPPTSADNPAVLTLTPEVQGTAETGSVVRIYTDAACTTLAATGVATSGAFSIPVLVVLGSQTTFYARATDAAANSSPCSTTNVTYYTLL